MKVFIDNTEQNDLKLELPLQLGGGLLYEGKVNNKAVWLMNMKLTKKERAEEGDEILMSAESHIVVFLHELMHGYQQDHFNINYGNLRINPDENFAIYSTLEGMALNQALEAKDEEEERKCLIDFCIARQYKNEGLTEREKKESAADESREGQAVFVELMCIKALGNGFNSIPEIKSDPDYHYFQQTEELLKRYQDRLKTYTGKILEIYEKNYQYGSYQGLFLYRNFSNWHKEIEAGTSFAEVLQSRLNISNIDSLLALSRFQDLYNFDEVSDNARKIISTRNNTYRLFSEMKGVSYIINFRRIEQWVDRLANDSINRYELGLLTMYPKGLGDFEFDNISLKMNKGVPVAVEQLFHIKMVDEKPRKLKPSYTLSSDYLDDDGIHHNAIIHTPLFDLKVPKVSIAESKKRIKFIVHSRI